MTIKEKLKDEELALVDIIRHPIFGPEFIRNYSLIPEDPKEEIPFDDYIYYKHRNYQILMLCDFNHYVSFCTARAVGKTESLIDKITFFLLNDFWPDYYITFAAPSKVHLEIVFNKLRRWLQDNNFLKRLVDKGSVNSSAFTIKLSGGGLLYCRIAGTTGTGQNVVGLHTPVVLIDECVVGSQKISCKGNNKAAFRLRSGDIVLSWDGSNIVEDRIVSVHKKPLLENVLEIDCGNYKTQVGQNHRFYTTDGYIKASNLKVGDTVFSFKNTERRYWNDSEVEFIKDQISKSVPVYDIAKALNRTDSSIFHKLHSLGISYRDVYDQYELTNEEYQIILGSLLGDGSTDISLERATYHTNHSLKQKEYVDWLVSKLSRLVRSKPRVYRNGGWGTYNYAFSTLGHPKILEIVNELYINNKKTITREYLNKLEPLGLAVWFMDDGSKAGTLSTHSFSLQENKIIVDYLKDIWDIKAQIRHDKRCDLYYIDISRLSLPKFREIIKPHIPNCMLYKIDLGIRNDKLPPIEELEFGEDISTLQPLKIKNIRVVNTRAKYLYSIETELYHNFFVNGILTKNSAYFPWGTWSELQPIINHWMDGFQVVVAGVPDGRRERSVLYYVDQKDPLYTHHRITSHMSPTWTEDEELRAREQYGGEHGDNYIHMVLGQHGSPTFSVFDRSLMLIEPYETTIKELRGLDIEEDPQSGTRQVLELPPLPKNSEGCLFGIDLGYNDPTAIIISYLSNGIWRNHVRLNWKQVTYEKQEKLIVYLIDKFNPSIVGIDEGSSGKAVIQHLFNDEQYKNKKLKNIIVPISFSSTIPIGKDEEGKDILVRAKEHSVQYLSQLSNTHKISYSSWDEELIVELERTTYTKSNSGQLTFTTFTERGGLRGSDHNLAALLSGFLGWYLRNETAFFTAPKPKLLKARWWASH